MSEELFKLIDASAAKMGSCEPKWLKQREVPDFTTVETENGKPPIVLLHGLLGALSNWEDLLPEIASFSHPIALQFPILSGHRSEVKVKALAAFTEFFIRQRKLGPVVLCGNSLGGHVAMRLCLAAPELIDCLVLSGTSGLYEHSVDSLPVRPNAKYIREHMGRVFYNERFTTEERIEEIVGILSKRMNTLNLIHAARSAKKDNMLHALKDIKVPTLLLWGEDDEITTMDVAETFHKHIPNSTLATVENCGHAPMIEYPQWFAQQMQKFLSQHSSKFSA